MSSELLRSPVAGGPERVLLDTNVLLSGVLFGGKPGELVEAARRGGIRAVTSVYILRELQDVLSSSRFGFDPELCEDLAVELAAFMEVVPVLPSREHWVSDPKDDPVVEAALQGGAAVIVTGDKRLLQTEVPGLEIVTVAEMVGRLTGL
jgi:putative PIN family toxin of toxin-antitoxin system